MKLKNLLFLLLFIGNANLNAQTTYQTTETDPTQVYSGYLGINYFTVDAGFSNTTGASIWSVGIDALYPLNEKLRIEVLSLYSLLSLEKDGPAFLLNAGAEYVLSGNVKEKEVPVLLSFSWEDDYFNNTEVQTWESVSLPASMKYELVGRAGLYARNSAFEYSEGFSSYDVTNLTHFGFFAGVGYNMKSYLKAVTSDGYEFAAGRSLRPYFDILVLPTSVDVTVGGATVKTVEETLGWRLGAVIYSKPYTKAENFGRKIPFFANSVFRIDIGKRPLEGFFVTTGIAYNFKKFK